jgi:Integrase zinc binding domain
VFARAISLSSLEQHVFNAQLQAPDLLSSWHDLHPHVSTVADCWFHCHVPIVVADNALRQEVLTQYYDHPLAGHPGIFKTYLLVSQDYWWPNLKQFIKNYVKGCATCQMTKSRTNKPKIPIFPITTERNSTPFETITMDLIVDLPHSNNYDLILTITDHNCTKVALFLPCSQTIDVPGIAQLYA